jgi:hypothetical protein
VDFSLVLRTVLLLTVTCGALAVLVAIASAVVPMPVAGQLVAAFTDTFKLGVVAIFGSHRRPGRSVSGPAMNSFPENAAYPTLTMPRASGSRGIRRRGNFS